MSSENVVERRRFVERRRHGQQELRWWRTLAVDHAERQTEMEIPLAWLSRNGRFAP